MHPTIAHSLVDQRRTEFMARAERHRQAHLVRRTTPPQDAVHPTACPTVRPAPLRGAERVLALLALRRDAVVAFPNVDGD